MIINFGIGTTLGPKVNKYNYYGQESDKVFLRKIEPNLQDVYTCVYSKICENKIKYDLSIILLFFR